MSEPVRRTIARNVRALRIAHGLKQREAVERLAAEGIRWSVAIWSAMERSAESERTRAFTADEIAALAAALNVSPNDLFDLPTWATCPRCGGSGRVLDEGER